LRRHQRAVAVETHGHDAQQPASDAWTTLQEFAAQIIIALDAERFVRTVQLSSTTHAAVRASTMTLG
jgi:hypothetical protein